VEGDVGEAVEGGVHDALDVDADRADVAGRDENQSGRPTEAHPQPQP